MAPTLTTRCLVCVLLVSCKLMEVEESRIKSIDISIIFVLFLKICPLTFSNMSLMCLIITDHKTTDDEFITALHSWLVT